jgi:hypothetical protein
MRPAREARDEAATPGAGSAAARPSWYRRRGCLAAVAAVMLVVGVGIATLAVAWSHRGADEKSVQSAVDTFRRRAQDLGAGVLRPPPGVYSYQGTGTEKLSVLATSQQWGPRIPGTVTHQPRGCWTFRVDYSTNHAQTWSWCPTRTVLRENGGRTTQTFDFVAASLTDVEVFTCDPPPDTIRLDARPGDRWKRACAGHSVDRGTKVQTKGTSTYVGPAGVVVAGRSEPAYHYRAEQALSGSQHGAERMDTWFSARDGLPLRIVRDVHVFSPSPLGDISYTERGSFVLRSITPRH